MTKIIVFISLFIVSNQYVAAQTRIKKISLGMYTTCIIDGNSKLKCWGSGLKILGNGDETFLLPYELKIALK